MMQFVSGFKTTEQMTNAGVRTASGFVDTLMCPGYGGLGLDPGRVVGRLGPRS
jgi:hypothetical protein